MILETRNLHKWYGHTVALNGVTLSAEPGIVGLLGPNGSGKTTLLRLAVGLLRPSSGEIRILGEDPWNRPTLHRRIGYAPEHDGSYDFLTGREFVSSLLRLRRFDSREAARRADGALERVGLAPEAGRPISTYSRGMRQRVKLAQALAHDPALVFLDEPLTGADPLVRRRLNSLIRALPAEGKSVVLSGHILHEVEQVTDRIILIHQGRLLADGGIAQIRALLDRHPHAVRIRADRPRDLARRLADAADVVELSFPEPDLLSIRTRDPDALYGRLPACILETGCDVREISSPDDSLEAVFRYLTER